MVEWTEYEGDDTADAQWGDGESTATLRGDEVLIEKKNAMNPVRVPLDVLTELLVAAGAKVTWED